MMRMKKILLLAGSSVMTMTASATFGQILPVNATADASAASAAGIEDIVVVGEKRDTRLQDAALAITAISGDLLRQRNLNELADLNGYVPGLTVTKSEGAERIISIRGIGYETAQNPNSQPGVAFHIDGVYIAHVLALNQDLLDVDHIEVLRGPQGTVFGQTSTGGAINVITRKPILGEFGGQAQLSYGNYNYVKGYASVNVPVGNTLAVRLAGQYLRHDGYFYATAVPGDSHYDLDDADNLGLRASLLWKPNDSFTAELSGQTFDADHNAFAQKCVLCSVDPQNGSTTYIADPDTNHRRLTQDFPGKFKTKARMAYLTLTQDLGDTAVIKSTTAYQFLNKNQTGDNDRYTYANYYDNLVFWQDRSSTWTQEVTLSSTKNDQFDWTMGGFYLRQHALQHIVEYSSRPQVFDPSNGEGVSFQTDSPFQHTSAAGFVQGTYHASSALDLTAGARYSWDKITAQPEQYFGMFGPIAAKEARSHAVTGKLSAEYKVTPDNMLYLTGSKGYKPTGLNFNASPIVISDRYKQETVYAVEAGSKNDFLDKKLRVNLSAYYYWYKNFQFMAEDPFPFQGGSANIPKAETYGVEAEVTAMPTDSLRFDGNISLARGRFKGDYYTIDAQTASAIRAQTYAAIGFPASYYYDPRVIAAVQAGSQNTDGNRVPKLPSVQGSGAVTYTADLGTAGEAMMRAEVVYRGKFNYRIFNVGVFDTVDAYTLVNLYVQYQPKNSPLTFSVTAQNLFDNNGVSSKFADPFGSGTTSVEYITPRQVFGTIAFRF